MENIDEDSFFDPACHVANCLRAGSHCHSTIGCHGDCHAIHPAWL
jgi:hypothetical protein